MDDKTDWYGPDVATFGDRVAAAREHAGLTQKSLAKRLGVQTSTLRKWEDDMSEPRANRLSMLAGILGVSMMWLINGQGEGLDAPDDADSPATDSAELLRDMSALRHDMAKQGELLGKLEQRLRKVLREVDHV
jgi:transcriptional regulator with XRE-family HTH domain